MSSGFLQRIQVFKTMKSNSGIRIYTNAIWLAWPRFHNGQEPFDIALKNFCPYLVRGLSNAHKIPKHCRFLPDDYLRAFGKLVPSQLWKGRIRARSILGACNKEWRLLRIKIEFSKLIDEDLSAYVQIVKVNWGSID